ncbi:MAG: hypothetical protein AB1349_13455 [Elusimicrobiota bacterium]
MNLQIYFIVVPTSRIKKTVFIAVFQVDVYNKWKLIDISILSKANTICDERPMKPVRNENVSKLYNSFGYEFKNQLIKDLSQWATDKIFLIAYKKEIELLNKLFNDRFYIDKNVSIEISNLSTRIEFMFNTNAQIIPGRHESEPPAGLKPQRGVEFGPSSSGPHPGGPVGPNRIFDFEIRKEPLLIVELIIK